MLFDLLLTAYIVGVAIAAGGLIELTDDIPVKDFKYYLTIFYMSLLSWFVVGGVLAYDKPTLDELEEKEKLKNKIKSE